MVDWHGLGIDSTILAHLPRCQILTKENSGEIWNERKQMFLKPLRSFGAKQSFRGGSISRTAFDKVVDSDMLAQEFIPAPEITFDSALGPQTLKYDLRFYAYKDRIQSAVARLYQGQVTNLKTPMGGFAPIVFQ
jgi:hypothetical protein